MHVYGVDIIIRMLSHVIFIYLTFWSLKAIRLETFFQSSKTQQIRLGMMLVSIAVGYNVSNFFLDLVIMSKNLFLIGF